MSDRHWVRIDLAPPITAGRYLVSDGCNVGEARFMPKKKLWKFPSANAGFVPRWWRDMPAAPIDVQEG